MSNIRMILSNARFESYRHNSTDTDEECLKRYVWNIALSEALYPSIQFLEIAMRNSIHNAARQYFNNDFWFDDQNIISNSTTCKIIQKAKDGLRQKSKPIDAGRVIAELHFGFWRALFVNEYEKKLWRHIIKDVFPHAPKSMQQRKIIGARVHRAKELRNRIFHHEPIWHWKDLPKRHQEMLTLIEWMSPSLRELADVCDHFIDAFEMNVMAIKLDLKKDRFGVLD